MACSGPYVSEYIWIDGYGGLRSKTMVSHNDNLPNWNYDGSSTLQADGNNSEVVIRPVKTTKDPFRKGKQSKLVLCDTWVYNQDNKLVPHPTNNRHFTDKLLKECPCGNRFGFEQEFYLMKDRCPYGSKAPPRGQGDYYCGVGGENALGRDLMEKVLDYCLYAELPITGMNAEVGPSQWEFQVCSDDIDAGDSLMLLRYILEKVSEDENVVVTLHPKPMAGDWNGSGCHTNFSTAVMRGDGGLAIIVSAMRKFEAKAKEHIEVYGADNDQRLTGLHETAPIDKFSWGYGDRGASIRIPKSTLVNGRGYLEDRRPASNIDPYRVMERIIRTVYDM